MRFDDASFGFDFPLTTNLSSDFRYVGLKFGPYIFISFSGICNIYININITSILNFLLSGFSAYKYINIFMPIHWIVLYDLY